MRKSVTILICMAITLLGVHLNPVFAAEQAVQIGSSPNPVGSGARALGMGGAFIGVADDATAASWNPGGLIKIPEAFEMSLVGAWFSRSEDNTFEINPEADGSERVSEQNVNYFSMAYRFEAFNRGMAVSLNYQHLYDFSRDWRFSMKPVSQPPGDGGWIPIDGDTSIPSDIPPEPGDGGWLPVDGNTSIPSDIPSGGDIINGYPPPDYEGPPPETTSTIDYRQNGSLSALGLAYCIAVVPARFFVGFTLNFWNDNLFNNKWEETYRDLTVTTIPIPGEPPMVVQNDEYRKTDRYSFSGFNYNIGILFTPYEGENDNEGLDIGLVFKSPFTADIEHEITEIGQQKRTVSEKLDMPMSYGLGIAYRFSDFFRLSADIYRTEWDDYISRDSGGNEISPITGGPADETDIDPTYQVRLGAEYKFMNPASQYIIPVRGGVFYDPAPAQGSPDKYYGFTLGAGVTKREKFSFDMAFQYRFGNDVNSSLIHSGYEGFSQDVREFMVYSSVIFYF